MDRHRLLHYLQMLFSKQYRRQANWQPPKLIDSYQKGPFEVDVYQSTSKYVCAKFPKPTMRPSRHVLVVDYNDNGEVISIEQRRLRGRGSR